MQVYPNYIACAQLTTRTVEENIACLAQARAIADAMGVKYVLVNGAYKGAKEISLQLFGDGAGNCARALAILFEQETYLEITAYHMASLRDQSGATVMIFSQRIDGTDDNYTEDTLGNRYTFA